jgi:hypothetical protein
MFSIIFFSAADDSNNATLSFPDGNQATGDNKVEPAVQELEVGNDDTIAEKDSTKNSSLELQKNLQGINEFLCGFNS